MEDTEVILIPQERIGALIGKNGSTKREIEKKTKTGLYIDSKEGEVEIRQKGNILGYLKAEKIVKAIARGFSPEHAFRLLDENCTLEIINIEEKIGKNKSRVKSKKGRIIGAEGRAREEIEEDSGANISVYGKTIGIIGKYVEIQKAKTAIEMLLGGASHSSAYHYLKRGSQEDKFEL